MVCIEIDSAELISIEWQGENREKYSCFSNDPIVNYFASVQFASFSQCTSVWLYQINNIPSGIAAFIQSRTTSSLPHHFMHMCVCDDDVQLPKSFMTISSFHQI